MAPSYRHVATGRVIGVREGSLVAHLVEADSGYVAVKGALDVGEVQIPLVGNERSEEILAETLERLAEAEARLAEAEARLAAEPVAVTDPPSPIGEDGIPVLTDPADEVVTEEVVEETAIIEEEVQDAGNGGGRSTAPRTRARRRGDAAS